MNPISSSFITLILIALIIYLVSTLCFYEIFFGKKISEQFIDDTLNAIEPVNIGMRSYHNVQTPEGQTGLLKLGHAKLIELIRSLHNTVELLGIEETVGTWHKKSTKYCSKFKWKSNFYDHQHSTELWIPYLFKNHATNRLFLRKNSSNNLENVLFHYVEVRPHMALVCQGNKRYPEDWHALDLYWVSVMSALLNSTAWIQNNGMNFIIPASHPMVPVGSLVDVSKPLYVENLFDFNTFSRATFLVVDHDDTGKYPKDIVIPYVADSDDQWERVSSEQDGRRNISVFFASAAVQSLRSSMLSVLTRPRPRDKHSSSRSHSDPSLDEDKDIVIVNTAEMPHHSYIDHMHRAKFCLVVRGDTTSTRRLFGALLSGCVPVIISDWLARPFDRFIDYSQFSITVSEGSAVRSPWAVIDMLKSVTPERLLAMQSALRQARSLLLYDSAAEINPLSLMLAEAFMLRLEYCRDKRVLGDQGDMCYTFEKHMQTHLATWP